MASVSLCMIVRDEAAVLERCLESARGIADEICITDTGSADETREIAARYGRVTEFPWCDDFSAARNFSFEQAHMDYILWLDADDVILPEDRARFLALKARLDGKADVVMLPYHTGFDERGRPTFFCCRERLLKRSADFRWQGAVHECIVPRGHIVYGDAAVTHRKIPGAYSDRNLKIYEKLLQTGEKLDARGQYYYARELLMHKRYEQAAQAFEEFLSMPDGWIENRIEACVSLSRALAALGQREAAKRALTRSFVLDTPRSAACCALAALELDDNRVKQAKFWYETAIRVADTAHGGFVDVNVCAYTPALGLCLCWDRLGDPVRAAEWNERAALVRPQSAAVAYNRRYFANRGARSGID